MDNNEALTKCAWRLIPFMVALYIVNFIDPMNIGFAALTMNVDLGFPPAIYGFDRQCRHQRPRQPLRSAFFARRRGAGFPPGMIFYLALWFPRTTRARFTASFILLFMGQIERCRMATISPAAMPLR